MPLLHAWTIVERVTRRWGWLALACMLSRALPASGEPTYATPTLYLSGDTLLVDLRVDCLFSRRTSEAIASGMTTSIAYEFEVAPIGPGRTIQKNLSMRLDHDIWEGRYEIFLRGSTSDSLVTTDLAEANRYCSTFNRTPIGTIPEVSTPFVFRIRSTVNPISPEQEVKTRRWLNLLERGSVLELFFSFEPKGDRQDWVDLARFSKDDLPIEVVDPEPQAESDEP